MRASLLIAVLAAVFVWLTSRGLPSVVASHFDAAGVANGFMTRNFYAWFMLAFVVGLPLLLSLLPNLVFRSEKIRINLPNREYWLAPERRRETHDFLCRHNSRFGVLLTLFLCYVHWLVLRANAVAPPRLPSMPFIIGLALFGVLSVVWVAALLVRFRKVPPRSI